MGEHILSPEFQMRENPVMHTILTRRLASLMLCGAIFAAGSLYAADPAALDLERMRLEREQRQDEMRVRMELDRRTQELQARDAQRRMDLLGADGPQLKMRVLDEQARRRVEVLQRNSQQLLSQQLLYQSQLVQQRQLRQRLISEPDGLAGAQLQAQRHRFMRERQAQALR